MNKLENKKYWIWLSLVKGIGVRKKLYLLEKYQTPEEIYNKSKKELMKIKGFGESSVNNILSIEIRNKMEKHINLLLKNNIDIITIYDDEYPELLRKIYDKPICLYIKGNKEILRKKTIGIVGCREATPYGRKVAEYFSFNLAKHGFCIVSGLAKGIDSFSHIGAIAAKGKTVAVIGNGLDIIYPKENEILSNEIISRGGAIITEYPLGTKPERMNFPARNRIISGMSEGILVVEAKSKSGTLITVDFALEQGRDVYVVPGNINSINSVGTNELIKQGAKMVTNYREIMSCKY